MSTANEVPETYELTGDDAKATLHEVGAGRLLTDSFRRFRVADGFSHSRSLAFMTTLVIVQALIALVGLAIALGQNGISDAISRMVLTVAPGPTGETLTAAITQATGAGLSHRYLALLIGLVGGLVSGTTAMGQLERGLNRLYGIEQDRPSLQKYSLALGLTLSAGVLLCAAFALIAFGRAIIGDGSRSTTTAWGVVGWLAAVGAITAAVTLLFRRCPNRRQPGLSWLAFGAAISVGLWVAVTLALSLFFRLSSSFGRTYGPLAGLVALQLWALLSSIAVLFGAAVAAELEGVRAGRPRPQDQAKVERSEPAAPALAHAG
jgi:YihY family inner membrane protein